ncbi:MAG: PLP-dependent transferase, partial [Polyangiaceae bacterium]|nr:PLP-dependent transferase [Polyangiaceae bacterium]
MKKNPRFARSTDAVHSGIIGSRPHNALSLGVTQTATYTFENTADLEQYMRGEDDDPEREEYGRYGNPTVRELERRFAALEATDDAAAFSTGMAAITS